MNIALIFAGGTGKRMNSKSKPKQFLELNGKPILIHTIEHFEKCKKIDYIYIVCLKEWISYLNLLINKYQIEKVKKVLEGGLTGQESIRNGIFSIREDIDEENAIVLIHDGVRPLINQEVILDNITSVEKYGSAITVIPAYETVIKVDNNTIQEVVDRESCRLARAPQSFYLSDIYESHKRAFEENKIDFIDSATLMRNYGYKLHCVEGPIENIKITTPSDFYIFRAILEAKENSQIWGI